MININHITYDTNISLTHLHISQFILLKMIILNNIPLNKSKFIACKN